MYKINFNVQGYILYTRVHMCTHTYTQINTHTGVCCYDLEIWVNIEIGTMSLIKSINFYPSSVLESHIFRIAKSSTLTLYSKFIKPDLHTLIHSPILNSDRCNTTCIN